MAAEDRRIAGAERAALYIRVSSEEQAMHGLSLTAQRETLTHYAAANGLKVVGLYADEGVTARKKYRNRAEFMRMLDDVQAERIDVILFIKLDRWFRNVADYYEVQKVLDAHNVVWIATEENYDTTTANGRLHLNIKLSIAQDESDRTSERIKFVFDSKVKRGEVVSGKVPLGYCIRDKHLCIVPDRADIVRDIFDKYVVLRSIRSLRQYIMDTHGIIYTHTNIKMLLQNGRYIGHAHGEDNFCPPIIDAEVFANVQAILQERAQRNSCLRTDRIYLFPGLVYCAECGNRLSVHVVGQKYIYYRCTKYEKLHLCCHKKRTSELILEDWLLHNLAAQYEQYNTSALEQLAARRDNQADDAKIKNKMEKLKDLYLNDLIARDVYERDYKALRSELKASSAASKPLPQTVDIAELKGMLAAYTNLTRKKQREFWRRTIGRITVTNNDEFSVSPFRHN